MTNETTKTERRGRLDADARPVAWTLAGLLGLTAMSAMALSFQAHMDVAASRLGAGPLAPAYPVAVDGALVGLAVAMLVQARRGESRILSGAFLTFFTLLSSIVNVIHVLDLPTRGSLPYIGATFGGLLPVMVLGLTEVLCRVVFSPAQGPEPAAATKPVPEPDPRLDPTSVSVRVLEPATTVQPVLRPKAKRRTSTASAVPENRVGEIHAAIDRLLGEGLSRQAIADQLTYETGLTVSKSRVSRRADALKEAAA